MRASWQEYNDAQAGREPRQLCRDVLDRAGPGDGRLAVDLGCGAGIESAAMLDAGWRVLAVDSDPSMPGRLRPLAEGGRPLETMVATFEGVRLPAAGLVHAGFSLPFARPDAFAGVWDGVRASLEPAGWLAVNLFGVRDSWAGEDDLTFHTRDAVEALLDGLRVDLLDEEERDGEAFSGPKHWHVFHVIAQAP